MKPETAGKIKYGVWGLIVGAVIAMIIGFAWGLENLRHGQNDDRRSGLGESGSDLRRPIYAGPEHEENLKEFEGN